MTDRLPSPEPTAAATDGPARPEQLAWSRWCERLAGLAGRVASDEFAGDRADEVSMINHLAEQAGCWLSWSTHHADPYLPRFQRHNDLVTPWGGPNADNVYRHSRVDPALRYRITGRMHSCEDFVLAIRAGFMHQRTWGTLHLVSASELGLREGDDIDLLLGGEGDDDEPGWIPLPEGAQMVSIREYYFDWRPLEPATFTIRCLDERPRQPHEATSSVHESGADRLEGKAVAMRIDAARAVLTDSIEYWSRYLTEHRANGVDNQFAPPGTPSKGLAIARYRFCFWDLAPDEALVVTTAVPAARYWSLMLYEMGTFELIDPDQRQSSLNHRQLAIDDDGLVRVVVGAGDPGVANWLDTGGRRSGLLTLRWFWPVDGETPQTTTAVVPASELDDLLPDGTSRVLPGERAAALAARRDHLAWRFRV